MQYTLITAQGKIMQFYILAVAQTYQALRGGVVFTQQILEEQTAQTVAQYFPICYTSHIQSKKEPKMKSIKEQFPGIMILDTEPVLVENFFSGETVMLTPDEVAVYDYLKGCELMGDFKMLRKALDWFRKNNAQAYMTLLD